MRIAASVLLLPASAMGHAYAASADFSSVPISEQNIALSKMVAQSQVDASKESAEKTIKDICDLGGFKCIKADVDVATHSVNNEVKYNAEALSKLSPDVRRFIILHEHGHNNQYHNPNSEKIQNAADKWERSLSNISLRKNFSDSIAQLNFKQIDSRSDFTDEEKSLLKEYRDDSHNDEYKADRAAVHQSFCLAVINKKLDPNQIYRTAEEALITGSILIYQNAISNPEDYKSLVLQSVNDQFETIDHPNISNRLNAISNTVQLLSDRYKSGEKVCAQNPVMEFAPFEPRDTINFLAARADRLKATDRSPGMSTSSPGMSPS